MIKPIKISLIACIIFLASACGSNNEQAKTTDDSTTDVATTNDADDADDADDVEVTGLANKGVGPIKSVTLDAEINKDMVVKGKEIFDAKCTACHKPDKKHIGPAPKGVLERQSPEWIMNMILNPEVMIVEDPDAKALLQEYNGAPMANQGLTEDEARAVLEYFRTL